MRRLGILALIPLVLAFVSTAVVFDVQALDAYDVAVTACSATPTSVVQGQNVTISVTIYNNGTNDILPYPVTNPGGVKVTVFYKSETNVIEYKWANLTVGETKILVYYWNTSTPDSLLDVPLGSYLVFARATDVAGELNSANNRTDDGTVIITGHDVGVKDVYAVPTGVTAGEDVTITVGVDNHGNHTETFDVNVYYGETQAASTQTPTLTAGSTQTLTFTWHTTGVSSGSYAIKANASRVTSEFHVLDNTRAGGTVNIPAVHDVAVTSVISYQSSAQEGDMVRIVVALQNQGDYPETFQVKVYYDDDLIAGNATYPNPQTTSLTNRTHSYATLPQKFLTFYWNTSGVPVGAVYTIKAVAVPVSGETDTADNTYIDGTVKFTSIFVDPPKKCIKVGAKFNVTVNVAVIDDLFTAAFRINWAVGVLNYTNVYAGPFMKSPTEDWALWVVPSPDYANGFVDIGLVMYFDVPGTEHGVSGSGVLVYVEFVVLAAGDSPLPLSEIELTNSLLYPIGGTEKGGHFMLKSTDLNADGVVGIYDLATVAINWDKSGPPGWIPADVYKDGHIDIYDLAYVAHDYGRYI